VDDARRLAERLHDRRGRRVVFLSHCLLNENTRYLGGAGRTGCVREVVERCLAAELGIVQLPCPEERAWGGVLKRRLLWAYGLRGRHPLAYLLRRPLLALGLLYTRGVYRRLADRVAGQIADHRAAGCAVVAVVGVDGSPSCGVSSAIDPRRCGFLLAAPAGSIPVARQNALLRRAARPGHGLFVGELRRALARRRLAVPFLAHDLFAELGGKPSGLRLETATEREEGPRCVDASPASPRLRSPHPDVPRPPSSPGDPGPWSANRSFPR
jgi:hypothetical protein